MIRPSRGATQASWFCLTFRLAAALIMFASTILGGRLPTISPDQYATDQKKAAEEFLADLRYHSAIGNTLSELAMTRVAQRGL